MPVLAIIFGTSIVLHCVKRYVVNKEMNRLKKQMLKNPMKYPLAGKVFGMRPN